MSIPVTLNNVANLQDTTTAATTINNNNSTLTTALADGLSRSGQTPNTMSASIDMSSNHILNLPAPGGPLEPVRLTDVAAGVNVVNGPVSYGTRTQSVGLTAVTGTALTLARSDSAPALDQTIAPTWTGQHTFNTAGGTVTSVVISGATAGALTIKVQGTAGGVITFPNGPDTLVGRVTTDTLTNKTIPSPTISGGALSDLTITRPTFSGSAGGTYTLSFPTIQSPTVTGGAMTAITFTGSMTGGLISNVVVGTSGALNSGTFNNVSGTTVTGSTSVLATGTGGIGYATGAGGATVTQGTNRNTGVTLSTPAGSIKLFQACGSSLLVNVFTLTNTTVAAGDVLFTNVLGTSAASRGNYTIVPECCAGAVQISVRYPQFTGVPPVGAWTSEQPIIYFTVFKSAAS